MRGAEVKYAERVEPISGAIPIDPAQRSLAPQEVMKALDGGAMVLMIPVNTVAQAQQVVKRAYYPPMGQRSLGPGQYDDIYPAGVTGGSYRNTFNDNVVVIAIVSTIEGVSQAKSIAGVPGVHALYVDTMNLESDSGYPDGSKDFDNLDQAVRVATQSNQKYLCKADRDSTEHAHLRQTSYREVVADQRSAGDGRRRLGCLRPFSIPMCDVPQLRHCSARRSRVAAPPTLDCASCRRVGIHKNRN